MRRSAAGASTDAGRLVILTIMPPEAATAPLGPTTSPDWPSHPAIEPREPRNLLLLAAHQIIFRVGWIFKTESVIMPAVLDQVAGAGWIRGCLPVLNRLGQSLPPVFLAGFVRSRRRKKRALAAFTVLMSGPFLFLSAIWAVYSQPAARPGLYAGPRLPWVPAAFLALYFIFFILNGLYQLSFGTVQGKLIRPTRRGRLLLMSTFWGTLPAMFFAWWLLDRWLDLPDGGFARSFAFTAGCFFLAGLTALALFEPADAPEPHGHGRRGSLRETLAALREDANLRRLTLIAALFGSGPIIFPHYQALAREVLGLGGHHLMVWVITQNAAVGIYSLFVGPLADRKGNRLTLRLLIFGSAVAPAFAVSLTQVPGGAHLFWLVFIPLGISPLVFRTLQNYALEICRADQHPRYLSTVSLGLAAPFLLSPAVGWLVDVVGFRSVFLATVVLVLLAGWLTFGLEEPRHQEGGVRGGPIGMGPAD